DLKMRDEAPVKFAQQTFEFAPEGERWRGYKHFRQQSIPACDWLLSSRSVIKLILERRNRLAMYSSRKLTKTTNVWGLAGETPPEKLEELRAARASFDPEAFKKFVKDIDRTYRYYRNRAQGRILTLSYDRLNTGQLEEAVDFLGLDQVELPPGKAKLYGDDIIARFEEEDHDTIRATLAELGREDWAVEEA
ncbi:MAG: hypothetical protein AAF281_16810, partial [Pseudomonadota bacterium]